MKKTYYYYISYDEATDQFWGLVDEDKDNKDTKSVYEIDSTEAMVSLISCQFMVHIDDAKGLEIFLKKKAIINPEDEVILATELLF